ncbi:hypothetical protein JCM19238_4078 [Vibrio ponticus]|nr:hypothetical protein JCM19238_4078 [Vibrio ponticus]
MIALVFDEPTDRYFRELARGSEQEAALPVIVGVFSVLTFYLQSEQTCLRDASPQFLPMYSLLMCKLSASNESEQ